jgi:hypothetical protein
MPFELGLFLGCKRFREREKRTLVLDREPFRYRLFLSDLSGQDVATHDDAPDQAIRRVRDWLSTHDTSRTFPGASHIAERFRTFGSDLPEIGKEYRLRPEELTFQDYATLCRMWLRVNAETN